MNGTVEVQKKTLADIYEGIQDVKAQVALVSCLSIDVVSSDADYGLTLFTGHINDDLIRIEQTVVMLKESADEN